eukprot:gnl/Spiro4/18304_TR9789_c0_g1_i2.p1 gnl/Spiro4/18304_TR9789_c0_g1~~gnl/Spiro4/18304_TR9789_c0_g1_i2.p1  ORF type:complete len:804 (+),score=273.56 gnl/Spiro4/18304_TR9789_c0_g1_i2:34-2412(+)
MSVAAPPPVPGGVPPPPGPGGATYFVDQKKGEVAELRVLLRDINIDRDPNKKREIIKKVIGYMTLGLDMSRLFSEMVLATNTKDIVQKKLIYLYLCTYAESNAELSVLAVNTFQKDCRDEDPMIRGLALRSMCSLRLGELLEYWIPPLKAGLLDASSYVRKTAVIGCVKLHRMNPRAVFDHNLISQLYSMVRDRDVQVVSNCVGALNEILRETEGGMAVNQPIVHHLLGRIKEFNEWSQCVVLDLLTRYSPADPQETFRIMSLLDDLLKHSNMAVVLATAKVMINYSQDFPTVHEQVFARLKTPLITLSKNNNPELSFTCLAHVKLVVERMPAVFADEYRTFFCQYKDTSCIKNLKLDILTMLANAQNCMDIVQELSEYIADVDAQLARRTIQSMGVIAHRLPALADLVMDKLQDLLHMDIDYVAEATLVVFRNLLRQYPHRHVTVLPLLDKCLRTLDNPDAKVAIIWMLGEYGQAIDDAPYILEPLIDNFSEESSSMVKLQLISSAMKLFFKRPPEMQKMLGRLLQASIADTSNADVHDRALYYYRLLRMGLPEAQAALTVPQLLESAAAIAADGGGAEVKDLLLFSEFNSLSVVYHMPARRFVRGPPAAVTGGSPLGRSGSDAVPPADVDGFGDHTHVHAPGAPAATAGGVMSLASLLDNDSPQPGHMFSQPLSLLANPVLDAETFQSKWTALASSGSLDLRYHAPPRDVAEVERLCAAHRILCIASGGADGEFKLYLFACKEQQPNFFLVEVTVNVALRTLHAVFKADNSAEVPSFVEHFRSTFSGVAS